MSSKLYKVEYYDPSEGGYITGYLSLSGNTKKELIRDFQEIVSCDGEYGDPKEYEVIDINEASEEMFSE